MEGSVKITIHTLPCLGFPAQPTVAPNQGHLQPKPSLSHSPSADDVLLFSDGSKSERKVGAVIVHLQPTGAIIGSHLLPLPSYMPVFEAELYQGASRPWGEVERQGAISLGIYPSKLPGQLTLSIWQLITLQSDVYK